MTKNTTKKINPETNNSKQNSLLHLHQLTLEDLRDTVRLDRCRLLELQRCALLRQPRVKAQFSESRRVHMRSTRIRLRSLASVRVCKFHIFSRFVLPLDAPGLGRKRLGHGNRTKMASGHKSRKRSNVLGLFTKPTAGAPLAARNPQKLQNPSNVSRRVPWMRCTRAVAARILPSHFVPRVINSTTHTPNADSTRAWGLVSVRDVISSTASYAIDHIVLRC